MAVAWGEFPGPGLSGTASTLTGAELNQLDGNLLTDMTPGTGISTGTNTICEHSVIKVGGIFKTTILLDMTGLNDGDAADDVIGKDGDTANCHIGEIIAAVNGTIIMGQMTCLELPATGDVDIDLWGTVAEATLAQDVDIATGTGEVICLNAGDWTLNLRQDLTGMPGPGHLYLVSGSIGTDANYSAGRFLIELWGT